jgi:dihydrofolate reductase
MAAAAPTTVPPMELVAAVAANGVIGREGKLPWRLPDDLKHFKALTTGGLILMGRRTFDSIDRKPLPNRRNVVVSRTLESPSHLGVEVARSLDEALRVAADHAGPAFVVGGGELYAAALPTATALHLTELDEAVEGDAYFPEWDRTAWRVATEVRHERDDRHAIAFAIRKYVRAGIQPEP